MGKSVKIADLAKRMIELAGYEPGEEIKIEYTGLRPGEKLYEEVLSNTENTIPTTHDRIRIAKVREYDYAEACAATGQLEQFARMVNVPDTVCLMKKISPGIQIEKLRIRTLRQSAARIKHKSSLSSITMKGIVLPEAPAPVYTRSPRVLANNCSRSTTNRWFTTPSPS